MRIFTILFLLCQPLFAKEPLTKILFGSCIKQEKPIPIFETILSYYPEVFLFLGDNVYADTDDMTKMREKYAKLGGVPECQKLREVSEVMAVWDDHDYGRNDAGAEYPKRAEAQEVFLDFWREGAIRVIFMRASTTRAFWDPLENGFRSFFSTRDIFEGH